MTKTAIILAASIVAAAETNEPMRLWAGGPAHGVYGTNPLKGAGPWRFNWTGEVVTNWVDSSLGYRLLYNWTGKPEDDPRNNAGYQSGTVTSNTVALIRYKDGEEKRVVMESAVIGRLSRTYTISKPQRVYSEAVDHSVIIHHNITNAGSGALFNITNFINLKPVGN